MDTRIYEESAEPRISLASLCKGLGISRRCAYNYFSEKDGRLPKPIKNGMQNWYLESEYKKILFAYSTGGVSDDEKRSLSKVIMNSRPKIALACNQESIRSAEKNLKNVRPIRGNNTSI